MTDRELILLHDLLEDLETDEGVCYKTRSSTSPRPARCGTPVPLAIMFACRLSSVTG